MLAHELTHTIQQKKSLDSAPQRKPLIQRKGEGVENLACGKTFLYEFDGKINDEPEKAHRYVPRKFHVIVKKGEEIKRETIEEEFTKNTLVKAGQKDGLWRAGGYKAKNMPIQIFWVLNEYIDKPSPSESATVKEKAEEKGAFEELASSNVCLTTSRLIY